MAHLLIVEDDELLRDALGSLLGQAGHQVSMAPDGESALAQLHDSRFEGVVLDLGLPRIDGLTVLQRLRVQLPTLPVLILTARDGVEDRVAGLNAGADDYLTKPFNGDELKARLQSMLRRSKLPAFGQADLSPVGAGRRPLLRVDAGMPRAWLQDDMVELTQREWELLALLFRRQGQVVSREDVFAAWQSGSGEAGALASNALEVYVHRLRRKLAHPALHIRNIRGLGYMMELGAG
ncbi:MAG: response regulator transcription factor [Burkholderiaceae bacterium]|nr:response regulator transcription factor [Rhodoferax sp.]MCB2028306.1 response regulator transcription factor [Rhodoferax sp.]MCB2044344.1 response regulator transcription factor [Rhodoferax sp.]MCP5262145.1 response regulator transcription factor [Rhodoferax sp.]MCW5629181.1 response regulator transcription factor [Rhodoferax sp.]